MLAVPRFAVIGCGAIESLMTFFTCASGPAGGQHFETLAAAAVNCPNGAQIGAVTNAPNCWNGTQLDSADHRSHLAYYIYDAAGLVRRAVHCRFQ